MVKVPVDKIRIPDVRASSRFTPEQREFFEASVREFGVLQDPVVRDLGDGTYELIAGKSRLTELKNLGHTDVEVKIITVDPKTALFLHLAENVGRGTVDPISAAQVMKQLQDQGVTISDVAAKLGKSESYVRRHLALLELPNQYQELIADGTLTPGHIFEALELPTPDEVASALNTAVHLDWSVAVLKTYVQNRLAEIEDAKKRAAAQGTEPEIPAPEPLKLIQFKQCLLCGYQVPSDKIVVKLVCEDCNSLVQYIVGQLGPPGTAIDVVGEALIEYFQKRHSELPPGVLKPGESEPK